MQPRWWITSDGSTFLPTYTQTSLSIESTRSQLSVSSTASIESTASIASAASITAPTGSNSLSGTNPTSPSTSLPLSTTLSSLSSGATSIPGTPTSSVAIDFSYTLTIGQQSVPFTTTIYPSTGTGSGSLGGQPYTIATISTGFAATTITTQSTSWSILNVGGAGQPTSPADPQNNARTVCAGDGVDTMSLGVFSTLVFGLVVGAFIWLLFGILRPRIRQLYGMREWFIRPDLRPPPLGNSFFAFLHPPVPLVPAMPTNVSDLGDSAANDARLFPSDDELSQRTIWMAFILVSTFTFVGLAGALPLYMVSTPCVGDTAPDSTYGGQWSTLQDLSLLRVLRLLQQGNINTQPGTSASLSRRLIVDGKDEAHKARIRLLILTVLLLVLAVLPMLYKLIKEFNKLLAYHRRWVDVRCDGQEIGWLSVHRAPGLKGLGEGQVKELLVRTGMTKRGVPSSPEAPGVRRQRSDSPAFHQEEDDALTGRHHVPEGGAEIDISGVFTIVDTKQLAKLIRARDAVLNNLEKAECLYIDSFRLSTPIQSLEEEEEEGMETVHEAPEAVASGGRHISRPRPLRGSKVPRHRASFNRAPTSYMAPSSYYRLRGVRGVSGGTSNGAGRYASDNSLSDEVDSRVVGSRFQEVTSETASPQRRASITFGHLPVGERVRVDHRGELDLDVDLDEGPNHANQGGILGMQEEMSQLDEHDVDNWALVNQDHVPQILERSSFLSRLGLGLPPLSLRSHRGQGHAPPNISEESFFTPEGAAHRVSASNSASGSHSHSGHGHGRANIQQLRETPGASSSSDGPPPHLRLQLQRPIVRPVSGLHHEHLGSLYAEIRHWRTQLKALNMEVSEEQQSMYEDIARGANMRGWLLLGRGVRFVPGVRMVEGRSKDDIRWDDLQDQSGRIGTVAFWIIVALVCVALAGVLIPIMGLFLANAPDFAHFVPPLNPLVSPKSLGPAIATTLAPSLAAILFTCIAIGIVHYAAHLSGAVSNSQTRLTAFKATFVVLVVVAGVWMIGLGAVLYSLEALDNGSQETTTIAEGAIYVAAFVMILGLNMAFIAPGLLMLQPVRLWRLMRARWKALTPRQHFRAVYPRSYNPSFGLGACIIAVFLALSLVIVFPLLGPPLTVLIILTLIAHRYLVNYVYGRADRGQSGGLLQMWIIRRFATMLALQPFLLGLILLAFREWALAGTLLGAATIIIIIVETYTGVRSREPGVKSLSEASRESLEEFRREVKTRRDEDGEKALPAAPEGDVTSPTRTPRRTLQSMASVLDMIANTLALPRAAARQRGPVPLPTESINDLVSTARAAATSPDAPPQLQAPDPADEVADLLYPPELLAPDPIIWLTSDRAGVARSEASDLERYHHLEVVLSFAPASLPEAEQLSPY